MESQPQQEIFEGEIVSVTPGPSNDPNVVKIEIPDRKPEERLKEKIDKLEEDLNGVAYILPKEEHQDRIKQTPYDLTEADMVKDVIEKSLLSKIFSRILGR